MVLILFFGLIVPYAVWLALLLLRFFPLVWAIQAILKSPDHVIEHPRNPAWVRATPYLKAMNTFLLLVLGAIIGGGIGVALSDSPKAHHYLEETLLAVDLLFFGLMTAGAVNVAQAWQSDLTKLDKAARIDAMIVALDDRRGNETTGRIWRWVFEPSHRTREAYLEFAERPRVLAGITLPVITIGLSLACGVIALFGVW